MTPFTTLQAVAAPMPEADIDTDIIFPARFLLLTEKTGLGAYAFYEKRFDAQGQERPDFVLHRSPWRGAQIIVAGANFGCGSSREQAPWALADLGVRCLIAPGYGEIFEANCINNGILPITLPPEPHAVLMAEAQAGRSLRVDLASASITLADGRQISFALRERACQALLNGWDEIDLILNHEGQRIADYEQAQAQRWPWLWSPPSPL